MLSGEYQHSLDEKGRVNFPAKLREDLGPTFFITRALGRDKCLCAYSEDGWKSFTDKICALPVSESGDLQRYYIGGAAEVSPDKQGRVVIPLHLREYAGLDKDIIILGLSNRAEIWDKDRRMANIDSITHEMIVEKMRNLGF